MKKFIAGLSVGVALTLSITLIAAEGFYKGKVVFVTAASENILGAPNGNAVGSVKKGTAMVVLEDGQEFTRVAVTGFVAKKSITGKHAKLTGTLYKASMIVMNSKAEADAVLTQLKGGGDFAKLAKEKSVDAATARRGGDLGEFTKGDFSSEIENAILKLTPGQLSGVVKTSLGYHIFKRVK